MSFKKNKACSFFSILIAVILAITIILSISFTGCKTTAESEEEPITSEPEEDEITEEEEEGEEEDKITEKEITGNINILSGLEISVTVSDSRPLAIMVENSPDSRPQSGLIYADIIFEVVDEGGVTRYVAVYSSHEAEIVGPVRSARIYYAEIARGFDPVYTFWGTYPEAYEAIKTMDMDLLDGNSDAYVPYTNSGWRDYSRSNITEHTAFMSTIELRKDAAEYGHSSEGGQSPLRFKIDAVPSDRGNTTDISINFSYDNYRVDFKYDSENNNYLKYIAGSPHTDYETGKQIAVNNVIVMITDIEGPIDQYGHMVVRTTGTSDTGKAFFFMDGKVIEGTWERNSIFDPFEYKDSEGRTVLFNRGSTWVSMIQDTGRLSY